MERLQEIGDNLRCYRDVYSQNFSGHTRTIDQMRQAARSCKQNIVEGVSDRTVSAEMCIKLLGVARGSVRELLEDYQDFLRQQQLLIWELNDPRTIATR